MHCNCLLVQVDRSYVWHVYVLRKNHKKIVKVVIGEIHSRVFLGSSHTRIHTEYLFFLDHVVLWFNYNASVRFYYSVSLVPGAFL